MPAEHQRGADGWRGRNSQYGFTANWNSFNKPTSIFSGTDGFEFEYGVDGRRTRQLIFEGTNVVKKVCATPAYETREILLNPAETNRANWHPPCHPQSSFLGGFHGILSRNSYCVSFFCGVTSTGWKSRFGRELEDGHGRTGMKTGDCCRNEAGSIVYDKKKADGTRTN